MTPPQNEILFSHQIKVDNKFLMTQGDIYNVLNEQRHL